MIDISYRAVDGMFTAFFPNTPAGKNAWEVIAAKNEGTGKIFTAHAESLIHQLRDAGYTVSEADSIVMTDDELMNELNGGKL
ncbi:MAG TPA: hypothetical protein VIE65_13035 [Methylobacter sp.]|jgi:hypothetical protein